MQRYKFTKIVTTNEENKTKRKQAQKNKIHQYRICNETTHSKHKLKSEWLSNRVPFCVKTCFTVFCNMYNTHCHVLVLYLGYHPLMLETALKEAFSVLLEQFCIWIFNYLHWISCYFISIHATVVITLFLYS